MIIRTQYNTQFHDKSREINDGDSMTDPTQLVPVREIIRRTLRGESLDIHDYTNDNPLEKVEFFDIMDNSERIIQLGIEAEEQIKNEPDQAPSTNSLKPTSTPPMPEPNNESGE